MSGAIDAQALGDLMDGDPGDLSETIMKIDQEMEILREMNRRLLDQCRYQHLVLADIYGLSSNSTAEILLHDLENIEAKARAALSAVSKSGLLA